VLHRRATSALTSLRGQKQDRETGQRARVHGLRVQRTADLRHAFMLSGRFSNAVLSVRALRLHVVVRTTRGVLFMRATFWVAAARRSRRCMLLFCWRSGHGHRAVKSEDGMTCTVVVPRCTGEVRNAQKEVQVV
jgi:hypothetical protein